MKIAVTVKVLPDDQDIVATADGKLDFSRAKNVISTYDLNAIEAAAQLAEAQGAELVAVSVGPARIDDTKTRKNILSRGAESLHILADDALELADSRVTGKALEALLGQANITVNKNTIPKETLSPFVTSGVRIGTPAVTTRGMKEAEMKQIAALITRVIREGEGCLPEVKQEVLAICAKHPLYADCVCD